MVHFPDVTFASVFFTAIGAALFWGKWGNRKLRAYALSRLLEYIFPKSPYVRHVLEFFVFIALGCVVGIGLTQPANIPQCFTAGLGWTGFVAIPDR